ncbi:heat shock protein HspQ [Varunaivibrio sulfuroxidans]|uniref:Heat shock protein HspQ n=1 Tax=Varunaivibrio sulfuroxidans TaxID=1773489 RepID=A0A4R3J674_9PROT|nr:heat shock protein HspQ [Varunaivibrio sulfuroxidans]TCS60857.1 heat shock protein HspQ [Varunaivibrio sulfuroxidans]WES31729.1 heat shock protein HspQ [Varunaivibrio sulfuroxidans]
MTIFNSAKFSVGQKIHHTLFDYRGVIVDVDPCFRTTGGWERKTTQDRARRYDTPWYHVLVDGADHRTYVAERNLEADTSGDPINHPEVAEHFEGYRDDSYVSRDKTH